MNKKAVGNHETVFLLKVSLLGFSLFVMAHFLGIDKLTKETQVALADNEAVVFTDVTGPAGVNSVTSNWGGAWADYDGDGYQDLYAGNHFGSPNLYHNNGNGTFTDQRAPAGLNPGPDDWHGAAWGDYNNDGRLDLYAAVGEAVNGSDFYVNNGDGTFTERASDFGIKNDPGRGREPVWVDYDRDGDLDIFVANAAKTTAPTVLYRNDGSGNFTDVAIQSAVALTSGVESAAWADYDGDGYTDFMMTELGGAGGIGYRLYRNLGDGTFTQTTTTAGFSQGHWPNSVAWGDYDNDGDLDIFFSRGYPAIQDSLIWNTNTITAIISPPSTGQEGLIFTTTTPTASFDLWKTDRRQYRSEVTLGNTNQRPPAVPFTLDDATAHFGQPTSTSGITFVWRDDPTTPWNIRWQRPSVAGYELVSVITTPGEFTEVISVGLDIPPALTNAYYNALYRNNGNGAFQQVSSAAGMSDRFANTQQAQWVDVDNDGDLDLYATNMGNTYSGNEPNRLYRNNGNGTFTDMAAAAGLTGPTEGNDECSAWADYNNDGFLDVYIANDTWVGPLAGPHKLYLNSGNSNHWLKITLTGTTSNRLGIGAKIRVTTGGLTQFREMGVDSSGACHNSLLAHFGLDDFTRVEAITVTWPSGLVQVLRDVPADQTLNITESPPLLTATTPGNGAVNVALIQPIILDFNAAMAPGTVVYILTPSLTLTPTWNSSYTRLILAHSGFAAGVNYTAQVSGQDQAGNFLAAGGAANPWQFTTTSDSTEEAPFLSATNPANGATGIPLDQPIILDFNMAMDAATLTYTLTPTLNLTPTWNVGFTRLTLTHPNFVTDTTYTVFVKGQNPAGYDLAAGSVPNPWQFATIPGDPGASPDFIYLPIIIRSAGSN
ncbi:MAG: hypothetical protein DPW09_16530 [Anaerolineae bacterium]|nr:hypothetical protein [Anaerolineae bacterium]